MLAKTPDLNIHSVHMLEDAISECQRSTGVDTTKMLAQDMAEVFTTPPAHLNKQMSPRSNANVEKHVINKHLKRVFFNIANIRKMT